MSNKGSNYKRVFISDLHMGDARSMEKHPPQYQHTYGWLYNDPTGQQRITMLADFLQYLIEHQDAYDELVILGDLLDHWVCPAGLEPTHFQWVVDNKTNAGVIENLRKIASKDVDIKLSYVPGNHDMLVPQSFMEQNFEGINFIGKDNIGVYESGGIAAEHGSQYTLFCGPNPDSNIRLPIGFYMSRAAAEKKARDGGGVDVLDVLLKFAENFILDLGKSPDTAMKILYESVAGDFGLGRDAHIIMKGLEGIEDYITVEQVAVAYADLTTRWNKLKPNGVSAIQGALNEVLELHGVAKRQYFEKDKEKIVVFGHTHKHALIGYEKWGSILYENILTPHCDYIYANSGTWINSHKYCNFVETESAPSEGKHYVRMFQYESKKNPTQQTGEKYIKIDS